MNGDTVNSISDVTERIENLESRIRELIAETKSVSEDRDYWRTAVEESVVASNNKTTKYRVEMLFAYGWDDAGWSNDGSPWLFDTVEEAQAEIDDFCLTFHFMHSPSDFRVVAT